MALPNLVSFNAAISACEKGWRWEEAVAIFQRPPPDGRTLSKLFTVDLNALNPK